MDSNIKFWERFAKLYTPLQEKTNQKLYDEVSKECEKYIDKDKTVLELACGTGQYTFSLYEKAKSFVATDFSPKMIEELKKRCPSEIKCEVQDATNITYDDNSFDVVMIANALHIMPEPDKAMAEIVRVIKPNGVLLAPTFIYNGHENNLRLWIMSKVGFKTFHKWDEKEYNKYIESYGFKILESQIYESDLLPENFVACEKV